MRRCSCVLLYIMKLGLCSLPISPSSFWIHASLSRFSEPDCFLNASRRPFYYDFEAVPLPPPPPPIIPSPPGVVVWARPINMRYIRTFPPVSGQVTLECAGDPDGRLVDCSVVAEEPTGRGLGEAAIRATTWARFSPETVAAGGKHRFSLNVEPLHNGSATLKRTSAAAGKGRFAKLASSSIADIGLDALKRTFQTSIKGGPRKCSHRD